MKKIPKRIRRKLWRTIIPYSAVNIGVDIVQIILALFLGAFLTEISSNQVTDIKDYFIEFSLILIFVSLAAPYLIYKIKSYLLKSLNYCTFEVFKEFQEKSLNETEKYSASEWEYKIERVFVTYCWNYIHFYMYSIYIAVFLSLFVLLAYQLNVFYFVSMTLIAALEFGINFIYTYKEGKLKKLSVEKETELSNFEVQGLNNSFYLSFNKIDENYNQVYKNRLKNLRHSYSFKNNFLSNAYNAIHEFYAIFSKAILFLIGIVLYEKNIVSFGIIATMLMMYDLILSVFTKTKTLSSSYQFLNNTNDIVDELFNEKSNFFKKMNLDESFCLDFSKISYKYKNESAFENISMKICCGDKVLIKGANGSGKSTLIKVLSGLYQDYDGEIKINGKLQKSSTSICSNYAFSEAVPIVLDESLENNIKLGREYNLDYYSELISLFTLDLSGNPILEFGGKNISGGQAQKISLIRNIIANKKILFLDEPTNNLDEASLNYLIKQVFADPEQTVIFVTHDNRLEKYANKVVEMNHPAAKTQ